MSSFGCCCGGSPCSCSVDCNPYLPSTISVTVFGRTIVASRNATPGFECVYAGQTCWNDAAVETNSWTEVIQDWGSSTYTSPTCPDCCLGSGLPSESFQWQVKSKASTKRWRQVHHELFVNIYPVNVMGDAVTSATCTTKMRILVTHWIQVVYYFGGSAVAWSRWRKASVTCDDPPTGIPPTWTTASEPTMPTVAVPPCFAWCNAGAFPGLNANLWNPCDNFSSCPISTGASVTCLSDWPASAVTTYSTLACTGAYGSCVQTINNGYAPDSIVEQKCNDLTSRIFLDAYGDGTACSWMNQCDANLKKQVYEYKSDVFDCASIPSGAITLTRTSTLPTLTDSTVSCGSQTFDFNYEAHPASTVTATL